MNVRGERIIIFGDSLTHHGADSGLEVWAATGNAAQRASSGPGDLLASMLVDAGAQAVRTNARVGRSAANFYEREAAQDLLAADRQWRPTKVVVMLGTNDIGRDPGKTVAAMAGIRAAYENMGAEVWAIGPVGYAAPALALNTSAPAVADLMRQAFGARFIDARALAVTTDRARDGVHFTPSSARPTAEHLLTALQAPDQAAVGLTAVLVGAGIAAAAIIAVREYRRRTTGIDPPPLLPLFGGK